MLPTWKVFSPSNSVLTNTAKLVKCVLLHMIGDLGSLSCIIPSLDHPPVACRLLLNQLNKLYKQNYEHMLQLMKHMCC